MSETLATKTLRLGDREVSLSPPLADDEYWSGLQGGVDDAFWHFCRRLVRPGDVCFDVGANLGVTSLLLAQAQPAAQIHAFEPGPRNAAALRRNLLANGAGHVKVVQAAVGDLTRRSSFLEASAYGHLTPSGSVEVQVLTLEHYLEEHGIPRLDLLKLDIEGSEWPVLRHSLPILRRDATLVYLEFNAWCLLAYGDTNPRHFLEWLCATFPAVYAVEGETLTKVERPLAFLQRNLVQHGCVDDLVVCADPDRLA